MVNKDEEAYKSISEVAEILNLINPKNGELSTHTLRYWEKEFKQINPKMINNRRYYSNDQIQIVKFVKFLLKDKGMTIKGVKLILKKGIYSLDDYHSFNVKEEYLKKRLLGKAKKILNKIKRIKYGKKNTH